MRRLARVPTHPAEQWSTATTPRGLAFAGHRRGRVGSPHRLDLAGGDPAVVGPWAVRHARPLVRREAVLAREPQDAAAGADAGEAQPRPQLAVALAVGRAVLGQPPDRLDRGRVRHRPDRPCRPTLAITRTAVAIDGRPRDAHRRVTRSMPYVLAVNGETCRLIASTSAGPKGGRRPAARSWPRAARSPSSARPPSPSGGRSRALGCPPAGSSWRPRRRRGTRRAKGQARRPSPRGCARLASDPRPAAAGQAADVDPD